MRLSILPLPRWSNFPKVLYCKSDTGFGEAVIFPIKKELVQEIFFFVSFLIVESFVFVLFGKYLI
jgi:hypothetical protein